MSLTPTKIKQIAESERTRALPLLPPPARSIVEQTVFTPTRQLKVSAGNASYRRRQAPTSTRTVPTIKLSIPIYTNPNTTLTEQQLEDDLRDTIRHEIAHLLTPHLWQTPQPIEVQHGEDWKYYAPILGFNPTPYHDLETPKYVYHIHCTSPGCSLHNPIAITAHRTRAPNLRNKVHQVCGSRVVAHKQIT